MSGEMVISILLGSLIIATGFFYLWYMRKEFACYTKNNK